MRWLRPRRDAGGGVVYHVRRSGVSHGREGTDEREAEAMQGKNSWYIVDGYRPPEREGGCADYQGHECIMILNCNEQDAHCLIDVYFMDREPVLGIPYTAPAQRISAFRSDDRSVFGDLELGESVQYSLRIRSDVGVIVQYGRMDVNQKNLAYMAVMGYSE